MIHIEDFFSVDLDQIIGILQTSIAGWTGRSNFLNSGYPVKKERQTKIWFQDNGIQIQTILLSAIFNFLEIVFFLENIFNTCA